MAQVVADRGDAEGARLHLGVGERGAPAVDVLDGELERVQHLAAHGVELHQRAAQPWFGPFVSALESFRGAEAVHDRADVFVFAVDGVVHRLHLGCVDLAGECIHGDAVSRGGGRGSPRG